MAAPANLKEGIQPPGRKGQTGAGTTSRATSAPVARYTRSSDDNTGYPAPQLEDADEHYTPREDNNS